MNTPSKIALATVIAAVSGVALISASMAHGGFKKGLGGFSGLRGGAAELVEQFDSNADQHLTTAEIDSGIQTRIARADSNGDGNIDLEEFQPLLLDLMRPKIVDGFQFLDADGDSQITPDEFQRPVKRVMSFIDRNDDGALSMDEMTKRPHHRGWGRGHHRDNDDD